MISTTAITSHSVFRERSEVIQLKNVTIVEASESQIEEIVKVVNEAYHDFRYPYFFDREDCRRVNAETTQSIMNDPNQTLYVLLNKTNNVVGVMRFSLVFEDDPTTATFGLFAIAADYRGQGIGKLAIHYVENLAKAREKENIKINLLSLGTERLTEYYESQGYQRTGQTNQLPQVAIDKVLPDYRDTCHSFEMEKNISD